MLLETMIILAQKTYTGLDYLYNIPILKLARLLGTVTKLTKRG